jgi:hypothetical protein
MDLRSGTLGSFERSSTYPLKGLPIRWFFSIVFFSLNLRMWEAAATSSSMFFYSILNEERPSI